jgi:hypothetical protein
MFPCDGLELANKVARSALVAIVAARVFLRKGEWLEVEEGYRPMRSATFFFYRAILYYDDALEGLRAFVASSSTE